MSRTKPCPACGAKMLLESTGVMLAVCPPQYPTAWRCGCGNSLPGPTLRDEDPEQRFLARWIEANR